MEKPPVLLIHGFGSSYEHGWKQTGWPDLLAEAGREVIGVDLLGHGGAEKPHDPAAYADVEALVAAAIAERPLVDVVGFSAGAAVALSLLSDSPERFRKVALMGIGDGILHPQRANPIADAVERGASPEDGELVVFQRLVEQRGNDRAALVAFLRRDSRTPVAADLARITCPVLVVIGDRDFNHPADELASLLPNSHLVTLRGVDHFATPADYRAMDAVLAFLAT